MSPEMVQLLGVLALAAIQVGTVAYWGGRMSARLDHLAERVGRLERV